MARHPGQISSNIVRSFVHKVKSFDYEVQIVKCRSFDSEYKVFDVKVGNFNLQTIKIDNLKFFLWTNLFLNF